MLNSQIIDSLVDIRIELLHYWQQETNKDQKEKLSNKLNELDKVIMSLQKKQEALTRLAVQK